MRSRIFIFAVSALLLAGCAGPERRGETRPTFQAERSLKQARSITLPAEVRAGHYLDAASTASGIIAAGQNAAAAPTAQLIYNAASAELTALLRDNGSGNKRLWRRDQLIPSQETRPPYHLRLQPATPKRGESEGIAGRSGLWAPDYFTAFKPATKVNWKGFSRQITQPGFGGPLVGIRNPSSEGRPREAFTYPGGVTAPVTATLNFETKPGGKVSAGTGARPVTVTLALSNPTKRQTARVAGADRPLAADFTAPLAYYPRRSEFWGGLMAMIHVQDYLGKTGLYMLEPYDPGRIPVIFVHGLASTPQMWLDVVNEIESDPKLRNRCQYWVFWYPTGNPMMYSAMRLRKDLAAVERAYPMPRGCVIVGHSMGGLLARLQATDSGRELWDAALKKNADKIYAKVPPDSPLKRALIFDADPHIKRLIFICVPHRGSELAITSLGALATRLISLPASMIQGVQTAIGGSFELITGIEGARCPTSIQSLAPQNPMLLTLDHMPIEAPYNSIIGDRGKGNTPNSSDGIVPYWSSHLAGAQSELIVPGPHGSFALPQSIAEMRRILNKQVDADAR